MSNLTSDNCFSMSWVSKVIKGVSPRTWLLLNKISGVLFYQNTFYTNNGIFLVENRRRQTFGSLDCPV